MRTRLSCAALIACALAAASPSYAQKPPYIAPHDATIIGGTQSCGSYVASWDKAKSGNGKIDDAVSAVSTISWLSGFLSRGAFARPGQILNGQDTDSLSAWLLNYCRANPIVPISEAAQRLENELAARGAGH